MNVAPKDLVVVGVGDLRVERRPGIVLATFALGSCVGLTAWDPETRVGGLLHYLLPNASLKPGTAQRAPATFGDTGIRELFDKMGAMGASKQRLVLRAAGGGQPFGNTSVFRIGPSNVEVLHQTLRLEGLRLSAWDFGGPDARNISLALDSGDVLVQARGEKRSL